MTFTEANKKALEGDDEAFGISTADNLCYTCKRNKKCMACLRYYGEIVTCNFYQAENKEN